MIYPQRYPHLCGQRKPALTCTDAELSPMWTAYDDYVVVKEKFKI